MTKYVITTTDGVEFNEIARHGGEAMLNFVEKSTYTVDEIVSCVSGFEIQPAQ